MVPPPGQRKMTFKEKRVNKKGEDGVGGNMHRTSIGEKPGGKVSTSG